MNEDPQEIRGLEKHCRRRANAKALRQEYSQCVLGTVRNPTRLERSRQGTMVGGEGTKR